MLFCANWLFSANNIIVNALYMVQLNVAVCIIVLYFVSLPVSWYALAIAKNMPKCKVELVRLNDIDSIVVLYSFLLV